MASQAQEGQGGWRLGVGRYLTAHIGQTFTIEAFYKALAETVPMHKATRFWAERQRALGKPETMVTLVQMRFVALTLELSEYRDVLTYDPPRGIGKPVTFAHKVTPKGVACVHCKKLFVPKRRVLYCSRLCGTQTARRAANGRYKGDRNYVAQPKAQAPAVQLELQRAEKLRDVPAPVSGIQRDQGGAGTGERSDQSG